MNNSRLSRRTSMNKCMCLASTLKIIAELLHLRSSIYLVRVRVRVRVRVGVRVRESNFYHSHQQYSIEK